MGVITRTALGARYARALREEPLSARAGSGGDWQPPRRSVRVLRLMVRDHHRTARLAIARARLADTETARASALQLAANCRRIMRAHIREINTRPYGERAYAEPLRAAAE